VPETRVRKEGRKDAATGVSSLSTLQKVFDPFFQLLMSYLALKHECFVILIGHDGIRIAMHI
jgi:hypothetical protein